MITNVMMKTCLNQKNYENFEFHSGSSFRQWSVAYVRNRKLSEGRIFPKAEFVRIFTEITEVWIEHTTWQSWNDT